MSVTAVLVSYNSSDLLLRAIESCVASTVPLDVVVVDNGSTDGSPDAVRAAYPSATVIETGANLGFAKAVNLGAATTPDADILLVNPDARLAPDAVAELLACAAARPGLGMYGATVLLEDGTTDPGFAKELPTPWSLFCFATGLSTAGRGSRTFDPESLASRAPTEVTPVGMVSGCVVLTTAAAWQALGGFDERFFMYAEDADLSYRARAAGFDPVVVPTAVAHHVSGGTSTSSRRQVLMLAGRSTYIRTHWSPLARTTGMGLLGLGVALRALGSSLLGRVRGQGERGRWVVAWKERSTWWEGYAPNGSPSPLVPAASLPTRDATTSGISPSPSSPSPSSTSPSWIETEKETLT